MNEIEIWNASLPSASHTYPAALSPMRPVGEGHNFPRSGRAGGQIFRLVGFQSLIVSILKQISSLWWTRTPLAWGSSLHWSEIQNALVQGSLLVIDFIMFLIHTRTHKHGAVNSSKCSYTYTRLTKQTVNLISTKRFSRWYLISL